MTAARRLAAILAADVVGYSRLMSEVKACIAVGLRKAGLLSSDGFLCVGLISASCWSRRSTVHLDKYGGISDSRLRRDREKREISWWPIMDCGGHR